MRYLTIILILLISLVSQTSFWPLLDIYGAAANLVLVLILYWTILVFQKGFTEGQKFWPIILAGLFLDFLSGLPFGVISFSFIALIYLVDWLIKNIFSEINFWSLTLLSLITTFFYNLALIILVKLFSSASLIINLYSFYLIFIEVAYNIILIWLIFYGIKKIFYQKQFV